MAMTCICGKDGRAGVFYTRQEIESRYQRWGDRYPSQQHIVVTTISQKPRPSPFQGIRQESFREKTSFSP